MPFTTLSLSKHRIMFNGSEKVFGILRTLLLDMIGCGKWMLHCLTHFPLPVKRNIGVRSNLSMKTSFPHSKKLGGYSQIDDNNGTMKLTASLCYMLYFFKLLMKVNISSFTL